MPDSSSRRSARSAVAVTYSVVVGYGRDEVVESRHGRLIATPPNPLTLSPNKMTKQQGMGSEGASFVGIEKSRRFFGAIMIHFMSWDTTPSLGGLTLLWTCR